MDHYIETIKELNVGRVEEFASLKKYTSYHVGGTARAIVFPKNTEGLVTLMRYLRENNILYKVLGKGSNVLFSEKNYNGVIVKLDDFDEITFFGKYKVRAGAGASLIKLSTMAAKRGLTGLEFASGIPGSVGGSVFMNAGAYGSDMGYIVERVKVLTPDLKIIHLENREMDFHYRSSILQKRRDYICLEVVISLQKGNREAIEEVIRDRRERRLESQPLEYPSGGSVFRNPEGTSAWKLIDGVGLKGRVQGGAMVSDKHANFVVNNNGGTADDVKFLIDLCHDKVLEEYGIDLKCEQEFVNWE